jgi:stage V sporulation protein AD
MKTWESAESEMQRQAFNVALAKVGYKDSDVGALFAGDLLNQCVGSAYGLLGFDIPYFGLYGACSTSGEGIMLAAVMTTHKIFERCAVVTSSHYCAAERQYRTPIEYGGQRTPTAQWTVTGAGAFIIGDGEAGKVRIKAGMPGRVIDKGINDASNMGAAMAPAVCDTFCRYFRESGTKPEDYDLILTGDLGFEGVSILKKLMHIEGYEMDKNLTDCGILIFDGAKQDTHAGGSGCGCSASVLTAYIIPEMENGKYKRTLFVASGAMMSPDSIKQGESIPAVGHLLLFES